MGDASYRPGNCSIVEENDTDGIIHPDGEWGFGEVLGDISARCETPHAIGFYF